MNAPLPTEQSPQVEQVELLALRGVGEKIVPLPGAPPRQMCWDAILAEAESAPVKLAIARAIKDFAEDFARELEGNALTNFADLKNDAEFRDLAGKKDRLQSRLRSSERRALEKQVRQIEWNALGLTTAGLKSREIAARLRDHARKSLASGPRPE